MTVLRYQCRKPPSSRVSLLLQAHGCRQCGLAKRRLLLLTVDSAAAAVVIWSADLGMSRVNGRLSLCSSSVVPRQAEGFVLELFVVTVCAINKLSAINDFTVIDPKAIYWSKIALFAPVRGRSITSGILP